MKKLYYLIFLCLGWTPFLLQAQEKSAAVDLRYGKYFSVNALSAYQTSRDFGVSPLFYRGFLFGGTGGLDFEGPRWDIALDGGIGFGETSREKVATFTSETTTFLYNGRFLYKFWEKEDGRLDARAGLHIGGYSTQRVTPAFLNASLVWESINSVFVSGKLNWRIRHEQSAGKFLFIRRQAGTRYLKWSTQLSVPLLHSVWRPGYAYIDDFSDGESDVFNNNQLDFGGIRFQWRSDFHYYLLNGNAFRLSYTWDAQRSPGAINRLELAQQLLSLGIMFRLN